MAEIEIEIQELLKAYSDIPLAAVALVLGILAIRKEKTKGWAPIFFYICIAAFLGVIAHTTTPAEARWKPVWIATFIVMFELTYCFTHMFADYLWDGHVFRKKTFRLLQIVFLAAAVIGVAAFGKKEMLFYVGFAACCLAYLVYCIGKSTKVPNKAIVLMAIFGILILMQAFSGYIPHAVVVEHIVLTVILFVIYSMSKE